MSTHPVEHPFVRGFEGGQELSVLVCCHLHIVSQGQFFVLVMFAVAIRFSYVVKFGKICRPSGTKPIPNLAILKLGKLVISCPLNET